jgi:hypothetical protein
MLVPDCIRHCRLALVVLAALAGCAAQPHPATPTAGAGSAPGANAAAAARPVTADGASAGSAAAAATSATAASASTKAATADTKFKPPSGWSTRVKNGETVYCRSDSAVGSRIPVHYCFSQAELQEFLWRQKHGKDELDRVMQGTPTVCPNSAVCN